jgi:hypothetical protein
MENESVGPGVPDLRPASAVQGTPDYVRGSELYQLVLHDIIERSEFGAKKYGLPLTATTRIDFLVNAYQELLDLLIYLRGEIETRKEEMAKPASHLQTFTRDM